MKLQSQQRPALPDGFFLLMKNRLCLIVTLAITFLGTGCGTINTVLRDDSVSRRNLSHVKSPCETIPRIYSGICALYAENRLALRYGWEPHHNWY